MRNSLPAAPYGDQRWLCTLSTDNWRPISSTSHVLTNRRNIHHRPALSWRFRDSGAGYKTTDLRTYLLIYDSQLISSTTTHCCRSVRLWILTYTDTCTCVSQNPLYTSLRSYTRRSWNTLVLQFIHYYITLELCRVAEVENCQTTTIHGVQN